MDSVLSKVGRQRHMFGATTNRLTHMVDNLTNSVTNLQSSRSRILDTDYVLTASEFAKRQILQQARVAMVAQANALPQTVMRLLSD